MFRRRTEVQTATHNELLRPPDKTRKQAFKDFFWDPKERTCLTRSPINWLSISVYYTIFLGVIILIFYIAMMIVLLLSGHNSPQYTLSDSLIGDSPGLNFFPLRDKWPLIWLKNGSKANTMYIKSIEAEFSKYKKVNKKFNTAKFGACGTAPFGYDKKTPCLYFRLNRVFGWKPGKNQITLQCEGSHAKDKDHIKQSFFSFQGGDVFDPKPYPYEGQKNFQDSIVALQLIDDKPKKVLFGFQCRAVGKDAELHDSTVQAAYFIE